MRGSFLLWGLLFLLLSSSGCAGRLATTRLPWEEGSDYIVVQYDDNMVIIAAWRLENTLIVRPWDGGICWRAPNGCVVHVRGLYSIIEVEQGRFEEVERPIKVDPRRIQNGKYLVEDQD